ncbi:hypothetical protein B0H19DRAFT_1025332 [Mycena capillaripes]|nr:hypothetical protein B0H19DRAFT_1025332 [Mycena capillaripes]
MGKNKRVHHRDLGPDPLRLDEPSIAGSSTCATELAPKIHILREKTKIHLDGLIHQERSVVAIAAGDEPPAPKLRPDVPRVCEPVFDVFSAGDEGGDGGGDSDDGGDGGDEGGRELRNSDNPLRQWAEDHRNTFLAELLCLEGCTDAELNGCASCLKQFELKQPGTPSVPVAPGDHHCVDCTGGGELLCGDCILKRHLQLPFHRIQHWDGKMFVRKSLRSLGLRIQLGHWFGPNRTCPAPTPGTNFVIIDTNGVHEVALDFCGCRSGGLHTVQLLRARLFPATTTTPRTAATFNVLRRYHLLSFESKCAAYEFYQSLARESDNLRHKKNKDRYNEFLRMTREWRHLQMLKRSARGHDPLGIANTAQGECALLCPACPQPGMNLPPDWINAPKEKQFLYALFLAMDANFRLKRKDVSTEEKDPGLGLGWAFFCEVKAYMKHVVTHWNDKQERSHCVAHDAGDKPDREARGTASSGVGAVDCARHNMKRPNAVGDLQLGERYMNMDYMFFKSIAGTELVRLFVSYNIACQWHTNIWIRMSKYQNEELTIDGKGRFITFLVPKFHLPAHIEACNLRFSFNLTRDVGQTDCEAPERGWSNANPLAQSTKEMGPGSRRDTLDDHFNDWNHKKIVSLGYMLRKKTLNAVPEMVKTRLALSDLEESLGSGPVEKWTAMAEAWEEDPDAPTGNPFETLRKDEHLAKVHGELAAEAAAREAAGREDAGAVKGEMHITELLAMGLQLEDQQRTLGFDMAATGLHPTHDQRRAMIERTSKLQRKIFAWIDIQTKFFPSLVSVRELEDDARARAAAGKPVPGIKVSMMALWLPSSIVGAAGSIAKDVPCKEEVLLHEYRLRVGQANEALHEVRRLLLVRTHLYKLKDTYARGVRANTRSGDKIAALNDRIKRTATGYRVAQTALQTLRRVLKRNEWQWALQELKEEDVRGLPRAQAKIVREQRALSWIWVARGAQQEPGTDAAMNEAVRIEWAKARARAMRWREEVDLLEEEMRRVLQFLRWRSQWWAKQVGRKPGLDGPQLEGEMVYAIRQERLQIEPHDLFKMDWETAKLPALIAQGRLGVLSEDLEGGGDDGRSEEGEGESSGEEEEAVDLLPQREVKSTYVDEVLTYTDD